MANHFEEIDGKPHRVVDGGVNLGLAVDVEKKDGSRTLMVPVISRRRHARLRRLPRRLRRARREGAHEHAHRRRPRRRQHHAHQPRRDRHDRLGAAADDRARARSSPPARSPTRPASATIGATIGAEKVMTMTSTYDHRVIQGAESGRFLALVEEHLQGDDGFYEDGLRGARRRRSGRRPPRPRRRRRGGRERRRRRAGERGAAAGGRRPPRRFVRARAHPRPPRGAPGPARLGARGRPRRSTRRRSA